MEKQITTRCVNLAYAANTSVRTFINIPFKVGKIVVKSIVSSLDVGDDWGAAAPGTFYEMKSDLVQNNTLGICGGTFYVLDTWDGVAAVANHINLPYESSIEIIYKYPNSIDVNNTYTFTVGDVTNNGVPNLIAPTAVFSVILEFHEF